MIRVLHSIPNWLAQTQTWIHTQVDCLPAADIESHVVCERTANLDQFPIARLHAFADAPVVERVWDRALRRLGVRRHLGFQARVARKIGARVMHSHFGNHGWTDLGAARAAGLRHVVTFYGYDVNALPRRPQWGERIREVLQRADLVLCEGPHMRRSIVDLGCADDKVRVHHLGVRLDQLPFRSRSLAEGEPLRVLIASAFTEKKGIPFAMEALGRLRDEIRFEVTVIGDARGSDESRAEKQKILDAIGRHGLQARVRLLGFQPYEVLLREMYGHHLLLAPSVTAADGDTEGGAPVTLIEAAATGMVVVSSRHCDIPNVVLDTQTGYLANERDVDGLAAALRTAVDESARWQEMLARGRARVESEFDAVRQGQRLAAIYGELAGS
ncbi:MAG TPA: glycosyltransferase [Burkholderiales bacterium]|nr:glycosyltransferase [Burkholderiales bacterium]